MLSFTPCQRSGLQFFWMSALQWKRGNFSELIEVIYRNLVDNSLLGIGLLCLFVLFKEHLEVGLILLAGGSSLVSQICNDWNSFSILDDDDDDDSTTIRRFSVSKTLHTALHCTTLAQCFFSTWVPKRSMRNLLTGKLGSDGQHPVAAVGAGCSFTSVVTKMRKKMFNAKHAPGSEFWSCDFRLNRKRKSSEFSYPKLRKEENSAPSDGRAHFSPTC